MIKVLIYLLLLSFSNIFSISTKPKLSDFTSKVYSQSGEDGIIKKIFEIIGTKSKVCIEFGADDGFSLSNTAHLWTTQGWRGILIEGAQDRFDRLVENTKSYDCIQICKYVGNNVEDSLEAILETYNIKNEIDLLSIDIDGNDYYIFESLNKLRPRVIMCEFNPTIPAHLDIYPEYNNYIGCSVTALIRIAKSKGYELVSLLSPNVFFVLKEEFHKFEDFETSLEELKKPLDKDIKYLITNYSGNYKIVGESQNIIYGIRSACNEKINGSYALQNLN